MIYNLRSTVQLGTTLIQWSATQSDVTDCVFGVWFSESSPVDVEREPDQIVFYSPQMTEYQTSFSQHEPCYVAVAAICDTEMSKVHEMFLDWSSERPMPPEDVIVFDMPLPVFDTDIHERRSGDPTIMLAF